MCGRCRNVPVLSTRPGDWKILGLYVATNSVIVWTNYTVAFPFTYLDLVIEDDSVYVSGSFD